MANSPEHIDAFESQIEQSLDHRIDELSRIDEGKTEALKVLKSSILEQIKFGADEEGESKYSEDLKITKEELEGIYEEIKKANPQILEENEIYEYYHFQRFLGIRGNEDEEIVFDPSVNEMTLFGEKIALAIPVGANEQTIKNYKKILKKIEERSDLKEFITPDTKIVAKGNNRLEFSIEREGEIVKYSASLEGALRIDEEPKPESIKEWTSLTLEIEKLKRTLKQTLEKDKTLDDKQKEKINDQIMYGYGGKVPPKYLAIMNKMRMLNTRYYKLHRESEARLLFDEEKGQVVKEVSDPRYHYGFHYFYYSGETRVKIIGYDYRAKDYDEELLSSGRTKNKTTYYSSGDVAEYEEHDEKGKYLSKTKYRKEGTIMSVHSEKGEDFYNEDGSEVLYRIIKGKEGFQRVIIGIDGKSFGSFKDEKEKGSNLTEDRYIENVKKTIKTREQFFAFEENFMEDSGLSEDSINEIRLHGKEVSGVSEKERIFESKYKIEIETEKWNRHGIENTKHSIRNLESIITSLFKEIESYPKILLQRSGLKKIYIFNNWKTIDLQDQIMHAGGISFGHGEIGIARSEVFDHELFHCIDRTYGGLDDDDDEWGKRAHGDDYKLIYGKSGQEAISSGKAYGQRPIGHPSAYGKYGGIDEDQAEMAEALMNNQEDVLKYIDSEPALAKKAEMIREFYYALSDGKMDPKYWEDVRSGKEIDEAYWARREASQDFVLTPKLERIRIELGLLIKIGENLKSKKWEESYSYIESLIDKNPGKASEYHKEIKTILQGVLSGASFEEAEEVIGKFSRKYSDRPEYHVMFGDLYTKDLMGQEKTKEHYLIAIRMGSKDATPYIAMADHYNTEGKTEKEIEVLEQCAERCAKFEVKDYLSLSEAYLRGGYKEKAEAILEQKIKENPKNVEFRMALARLYNKIIITEISSNPSKYNFEEDHNLEGDYNLNASFFEKYPELAAIHQEEISQYEEVLKIDSVDLKSTISPHSALMRLYGESGRIKDLIKIGQAYMKTKHQDYAKRSYIEALRKYGARKEISATYDEIIKDDPENPLNYLLLAELYEKEDPAIAFVNYQMAIEKGSKDYRPYEFVSEHYRSQKDYIKEAQVLELYIKRAPSGHDRGSYIYMLGNAYVKAGEDKKAIELYESEVDENSDLIEPLAYLYYTYENNFEKAKEMLMKGFPEEVLSDPNSFRYHMNFLRSYGFLLDKILRDERLSFKGKQRRDYGKAILSPEFLQKNPMVAKIHSKKTEELKKICQFPDANYHDYRDLASLYVEQGKIDLAISVHESVIEKFDERYGVEEDGAIIGALYLVKGDISKAIEIYSENDVQFHEKVIDMAEKVGAQPSVVAKYFDEVLGLVEDSDEEKDVYETYVPYLKINGPGSKFQEMYKIATTKYPEIKKKIDRWIKKFERAIK